MFIFHIEAETLNELQDKINAAAKFTDVGAANQQAEPAKRTRKQKADAPAVAAAPSGASPRPKSGGDANTTGVAQAASITADQAKAAFKAYHDSHTFEEARAVLEKVGASKFSEVPAAKYAELMEMCK